MATAVERELRATTYERPPTSLTAELVAGRPCRCKLAMTGEITLRGNVLPVGGIKEKILAARRSGIEALLIPEANRKNVDEIPREIRRDLRFGFVRHVREVFAEALREHPPSTDEDADVAATGSLRDREPVLEPSH